VEFEALNFDVYDDYENVWCYARLDDGDINSYEFSRTASMNGTSRRSSVERTASNWPWLRTSLWTFLQIVTPCQDGPSPAPSPGFDHGPASRCRLGWAYHRSRVQRGSDSFKVRYHLCSPSCDATALPAPLITDDVTLLNNIFLHWNWEGDPSTIQGFKLYLNGSLIKDIQNPNAQSTMWHRPGSMCVEEWEFQVTAYAGPEVHEPDLESAMSNSVFWEEVHCDQHIRVTFETLNVHNPPEDQDGSHAPGPITGSCLATAGGSVESVVFDGADCIPFIFPPHEICEGKKTLGGE